MALKDELYALFDEGKTLQERLANKQKNRGAEMRKLQTYEDVNG
ncbi:MAG: hypothetical protein QW341_04335 [Candidatus Bathyarchaeia archaeon]